MRRDRVQQTAERLAGEAFDRQDAAVVEWIGDDAEWLEVVRSAIAFCRDSANLTALKADVDALRDRYIDAYADNYYAEAQQIEAEILEGIQEEIASAQREERLIEAHEAATRG